MSTIYILTNRTAISNICVYIYIYIYIYIDIYKIHTCIHTYTHIGIRLDDTKTAPDCFFINSKAKKLNKIHEKRKLIIKACLPTTILLAYQL